MARILVIDDDERVRSMLRQMLEYAGHEVAEAEDGDMGLALHRAEPADLIITDILMPKKEGLETIMSLRREDPSARIIAMSGGGRVSADDYLATANKLGAVRTLNKPFGQQEMLDAIAEALGQGKP